MAPKAKQAAAAPAPKAEAKPAAKPKAEKKEKEYRPEDEIPKVPQPDREAHDAALQALQDEINNLQEKQRELSNRIGERSGGKEEYAAKRAEIRAQLDEFSQHMDRLQAQKDELNKSIGAQRVEGQQMQQALKKMQKSIGFTSEAEIDERIHQIECQMRHESFSLKVEKELMKEIAELKKNRPKVSHMHQMESNIQSRDNGLPLKEQIQAINAEMAGWREKKKAAQEQLSELMDKRKNQLGDLPDIMQQRQDLSDKIKEKIAERSTLRDKFREEERAYKDYQAELRRLRADRIAAERAKAQKEWEQKRLMREAEKLDEQPYVAEITLVEQTIAFCKSLTATKTKEATTEKKQTVFDNPDGSVVLQKKEDRDEEFYFAPTARVGKKGKKSGGQAKADTSSTTKPIKHNAVTFSLFDQLKLDAPITTDEIPALLEKLEAKLEDYQAKVKEWEEKREEMKKAILEGTYVPPKEDAKEEEEKADGADEAKEDKEEEN